MFILIVLLNWLETCLFFGFYSENKTNVAAFFKAFILYDKNRMSWWFVVMEIDKLLTDNRWTRVHYQKHTESTGRLGGVKHTMRGRWRQGKHFITFLCHSVPFLSKTQGSRQTALFPNLKPNEGFGLVFVSLRQFANETLNGHVYTERWRFKWRNNILIIIISAWLFFPAPS